MVAGNSSGTEFANNSFLFFNSQPAQAEGEIMLKNFQHQTLGVLIKDQFGDLEVEEADDSNLDGAFPRVFKVEPFLRFFQRRTVIAKVHTVSGDHVTMIVGNPAYESLVNQLAKLLVAEFKTINRESGVPGSIVINFTMLVH